MKKTYERPLVVCAEECAEGVFLASGAKKGNVNVQYIGVWDRWTNGSSGGKGVLQVSWSGVEETFTVQMNFNDTIDQAETDDASVAVSCSGSTVTLTIGSGAENPLTVGVHVNHTGANIDNLKMTDYSWS